MSQSLLIWNKRWKKRKTKKITWKHFTLPVVNDINYMRLHFEKLLKIVINEHFNGLLHLHFSKFLKMKIISKNEKGTRMFPYVTRIHPYMLLVCVRMLTVCYSYFFVLYPNASVGYSYFTRMYPCGVLANVTAHFLNINCILGAPCFLIIRRSLTLFEDIQLNSC